MWNNVGKRSAAVFLLITMCLLSFCGCGAKENTATVTSRPGSALTNPVMEEEELVEAEGEEIEDVDSNGLYIVENLDMTAETITLYSVSDARQLRYKYSLNTKFLDKFGKSSSWDNFSVGSVVTIGKKMPVSGALSEVKKADGIMIFENLKDFKINADSNIFSIGGSNYRLTGNTKIYSDIDRVQLSDITDKDTLKVITYDKDVLSICVTTGHGYIELRNTQLFNDSLIFIGSKIVTMIYGENKIEVPEGTYSITVANDGWGGTQEFEVKRNEVTEVDLDKMKGEGPSYCEVTFEVTVPDTYVYLDGKLIDTDNVATVRYGSHDLVVNCNGYTSWNKKLVVNSESATITLAMEEDDGTSSETTSSTASTTDSSSNSTTDSSSSSSTNNREEDDYDYEAEYLSTISDILSTIMN